jgi:hypothetical protein
LLAGLQVALLSFIEAGFSRRGAMPRSNSFNKWELIILRSAALILLVIATIQLVAPEILRLIREMTGGRP